MALERLDLLVERLTVRHGLPVFGRQALVVPPD